MAIRQSTDAPEALRMVDVSQSNYMGISAIAQ